MLVFFFIKKFFENLVFHLLRIIDRDKRRNTII